MAGKTAVKKKTKARATRKAPRYACDTCGLMVTVDEFGEYTEITQLECCGAPMRRLK